MPIAIRIRRDWKLHDEVAIWEGRRNIRRPRRGTVVEVTKGGSARVDGVLYDAHGRRKGHRWGWIEPWTEDFMQQIEPRRRAELKDIFADAMPDVQDADDDEIRMAFEAALRERRTNYG